MTDCPRCELADAIRASRTTGLAYALTADGFRPLAHDVDPFAGAPMADDDHLQPHGTRSAYVRHKRRGERPCEPCVAAMREYGREQYRRQVARSKHNDAGDILTTPTGAPLLVAIAGQHEPAADDARTTEEVAS